MENKQLKRFDNIDNSQWMTTPFERTAEGFLKGRAIVTCCGVFSYKRKDGTIQRELRLPEEVFSGETLNSLKLKPITLNHPNELVTPDNAEEFQVGSLGNNVSSEVQERTYDGFTPWDKLTDGLNVAVDMSITRKDAIEAVLNGKKGLSMGYTCDLEVLPQPGVWCGVEYDCIQRNIRYNHCAIVDEGRAGDNAKIELRIDGADAVLENKLNGGKNMVKKITLDGIEYEAEESVIKALNAEKKRADNAESELAKMQETSQKELSVITADRDTQKERADKLDDELKKLKEESLSSTKLDGAVKSRLELYKTAEKVGVEIKGDENEIEIKKAIISKVFPKASFDNKDEVYVNARYDATLETLEEKNDVTVRQALSQNEGQTNNDDARSKMIERMKKDSRKE